MRVLCRFYTGHSTSRADTLQGVLGVCVYVPVREQFENRSAKQNQESREISPWKPSAQHTPKPKTSGKQHSITESQTNSSPAVQQSTPTAKMAETPAALDSALEATTAADVRVPSAAADTGIIDVESASSSTDGGVGLSGGPLGQSLSPVTEQTAVEPGCRRTFSNPSPGACLCVRYSLLLRSLSLFCSRLQPLVFRVSFFGYFKVIF